MQLVPAKYYFLADVHLGAKLPGEEEVKELFLDFLSSIPKETECLYLLGDIFDFWGEFRGEHPRDYDTILASLKNLRERGLKIIFLKGNHDYWTFGYLEREIGLEVVENQPVVVNLGGKTFCIAHGDGLGKCGIGYSLIRFIFRNKLCIRLLNLFPAEGVFNFGRGWSKSRKQKNRGKNYKFKDKNDRLAIYSKEYFKKSPVDFFIYGHIHRTVNLKLDCGARLLIVNNWYTEPNYISYNDGEEPSLNNLPLRSVL